MSNQLDQMLSQLQNYSSKQRIKQDIIQLVSLLPSLQPQIGTLTLENGKRSTLLNLTGTIPMYYKSGKYNIPVMIWIVEMFPHHSPIVYVTPTSNMSIKQGHKHVDSSGRCYLPYLTEWSTKSNLYDLVNTLSAIFSSEPPVYEKQQQPVYQYQTTQNTGSYNDNDPYKRNSNPVTYNTQQNMNNNQQNNNSQYNIQQNNQNKDNPTNKTSSFFGIPLFGQYQNQNYEEQLNKKVIERLKAFQQELGKKNEDLLIIQTKIQERNQYINDALTQLEKDKQMFEKAMINVKEKDTEVTKFLEENEKKEFDIDKVIGTTDELSQQLLECVSQDSAIDDAMYFLGKKYEKGGILLDEYLSNVRELSKKQFAQKALLKKIAATKQQ